MNCSLLDDEDYINDIAEKIPIWLAEGRNELSDSRSIWDWMKYNIRAHTIQYSKRRARERNEREKSLQEEYVKAKHIFETDTNDLNAHILNSAKDTLELFYEEKVKGIIIRARTPWHEHGEKSTKYFLNLEKRNHIKKHMRNVMARLPQINSISCPNNDAFIKNCTRLETRIKITHKRSNLS